jgi:hypothetical protein
MRAARLQDALERLTAAIRDVESELAAMKAEHGPLASHIFVARHHYRNVNGSKRTSALGSSKSGSVALHSRSCCLGKNRKVFRRMVVR